MSLWLVLQVLYASVAWYFAARAVHRTAYFSGEVGEPLAATVRELRRVGRAADVARLGAALEPSPAGVLLADDTEYVSAEELVAESERTLAARTPPDRMLRGLATVGTTLGLLAAIAALRTGLNAGPGAPFDRAVGNALDSAVAGFVTALPCWTAVGLCRTSVRRARRGLEQLVVAMRSDVPAAGGAPDTSAADVSNPATARGVGADDPVDGSERDQ